MAATHSHWAKGGPPCPVTPKKKCDVLVRQSDHFHPGMECVMWLKPGNVQESCALTAPRKEAYMKALSALAKGEEPTSCLACEYGGPHHGPACTRRLPASEE